MTVKEIKRYKLPIMKKLERRVISTYEILAMLLLSRVSRVRLCVTP